MIKKTPSFPLEMCLFLGNLNLTDSIHGTDLRPRPLSINVASTATSSENSDINGTVYNVTMLQQGQDNVFQSSKTTRVTDIPVLVEYDNFDAILSHNRQ